MNDCEKIRNEIKKLIPEFFYKIYLIVDIKKSRIINRKKSIQDVFTEVYKKNIWGGKRGEFYSGSGSKEEYAEIYSGEIKKFIDKNNIKTVIDLGCGDFNIGHKIIDKNVHYVGIDIVADLIIENKKKFGTASVEFFCKNIITDELPAGDLCIVRQVFQHLSNDEILHIIKKRFNAYKYVIVTEHYPSSEIKKITPNKDKPHGPDTRTYDNSAVFLDKHPFNLKTELLFEIELKDCLVRNGETLKTFLVEK